MRLAVAIGLFGAGVAAATSGAALGTVAMSLRGDVARQLEEALDRDQQTLQALLRARRIALEAATGAMVREPMVRAVLGSATLDAETYRRAAEEHRTSADADLLVLLDAERRVLASSPDGVVLDPAALEGAPGVVRVGASPYLLSSRAVEVGGRRVGWLVAGDVLDEPFVRGLTEMTGEEALLVSGGEVTAAVLGSATADVVRSVAPGEGVVATPGGSLHVRREPIGSGAEVLLVRNEDAAMAEFSRTLGFLAVVGLATSALAAAAFLAIARTISSPVRLVTEEVQRVARGDLGVGPELARAEASRIEEASALAGAFRGMVAELVAHRRAAEAHQAELEEKNRRLEQEVAQRATVMTALEHARDSALAASRAKSTFLANMSHELRTPLNAILGYAELVADDPELAGNQPVLQDLAKIRAAGKHLLTVISDVLDLAKIEAGRMQVDLVPLDLRELVDEVAATVEPIVRKNGNTLVVEAAPDLPAVLADRGKLLQILVNLLGNAAKFTERGRVGLVARCLRGAEGRVEVTFAVSDTGIGMTEAQLSRIFEEFVQADASTTRRFGGTGLGLAISRRLADLVGAELSAVSAPGAGSTFTLTMAVRRTEETPLRRTPLVPYDAAARGTLLLVDDDQAALAVVARQLSSAGWDVTTASNGEQALAIARAVRPAMICLDVVMPGNDGFVVLRALKEDPDLQHIPVVMITMLDDRSHGLMLGAADYLVKPVTRERLIRAIERARSPRVGPVLVVEDDDAHRQLTARLLEADGYVVVQARDGRSALDLLEAASPALVVLDLQMPGLDGFEVVAAMKERPEWDDVPIVVLTGRADAHVDARLSDRVRRVLTKGHRPELLLEEIGRVIRRTRRTSAPAPDRVRSRA